MMVSRRSGAVASTHRMLSRKKGRQYGEGHQKALQISVRLLSLVGVRTWERARVLPGFRGPSAMLGIYVCMPLLPRCLFHKYTASSAGVGATLVVARGRAGTRPAPTRPWIGITPHWPPLPGDRTSARQGYWRRTY